MKEKIINFSTYLLIYILIISCFYGIYWLGLNSYMLKEKGIDSGLILGSFILVCNFIFIFFIMKKEDEFENK